MAFSDGRKDIVERPVSHIHIPYSMNHLFQVSVSLQNALQRGFKTIWDKKIYIISNFYKFLPVFALQDTYLIFDEFLNNTAKNLNQLISDVEREPQKPPN